MNRQAEARADRRLHEFEAESQAEQAELRGTLEAALRKLELYEQERAERRAEEEERKAQKLHQKEGREGERAAAMAAEAMAMCEAQEAGDMVRPLVAEASFADFHVSEREASSSA